MQIERYRGYEFKWLTLIILTVALVLVFFMSLFLGRYPIPPQTVISILIWRIIPIHHSSWPHACETVILLVRLSRIIAAMLVGAGLSISGASFQGLFRNPLVSPHILGVASGAGFGAALAILLSGDALLIQLSAFAFGIIAVSLTYGISRIYKTTPTLVLVLAGIIVGAFFSALISAMS